MQTIELNGFHLYKLKKMVEEEMLRENLFIDNKKREIETMLHAEHLNDEEKRAIEDLESQIEMANMNIHDLTAISMIVKAGHDREMLKRMKKNEKEHLNK